MARKNVAHPFEVAKAQSLAASFNSAPTMITYLDNVCYQINITTSDSIGTFSVQASIDYEQDINGNVVNPGHWITLTLGGGTPFANAANDQIIIDLNQLPFNAVRLAYAAGTPGTGHCDIWILSKQIGG